MFKRFKEKGKFIEMVKQFKINKSTIIFDMNLLKSIGKYPGLMNSSATLNILKIYFKDVKEICSEDSTEFK